MLGHFNPQLSKFPNANTENMNELQVVFRPIEILRWKVTNSGLSAENAKNYNGKSSKPEHPEPVTNCP